MTSHRFLLHRSAVVVCLLGGWVLRANAIELAGVPNFQKVNDGVYRGAQLRAVATTRWPAFNASCVNDRPRPREAPVISQTFDIETPFTDRHYLDSAASRLVLQKPQGLVEKRAVILEDSSMSSIRKDAQLRVWQLAR